MKLVKKSVFVTGGAGFIGSHLIDKLIANNKVTVYDNLSSGKREYLAKYSKNKNFSFVKGDLLDLNCLKNALEGCEFVFHLAANPDIRLGSEKTDTDLKQGTIATYNVLEAMRVNKVKEIAFSSSSTVFGEATKIPTAEDYAPLMPISLYGASKLAAEGLILAYCNSFDMRTWIFRFANIIGSRGTHGVIVDFINKLKKNKNELEILGDGEQKKSYLHVTECINGMLFAIENSNERMNIFNLGSGDQIEVKEIGETIVKEMNLKNVNFRYTGGARGWKGDVPIMRLSIDKIKKLGWMPKLSSKDAVRLAVRELLKESQ